MDDTTEPLSAQFTVFAFFDDGTIGARNSGGEVRYFQLCVEDLTRPGEREHDDAASPDLYLRRRTWEGETEPTPGWMDEHLLLLGRRAQDFFSGTSGLFKDPIE